MEYNLQDEALLFGDFIQLHNDYLECDAILEMQKNIDMGFGTAKFELNVAHMRMAKEMELKGRYGIPLHEDKPLEWFHSNLENVFIGQVELAAL